MAKFILTIEDITVDGESIGTDCKADFDPPFNVNSEASTQAQQAGKTLINFILNMGGSLISVDKLNPKTNEVVTENFEAEEEK